MDELALPQKDRQLIMSDNALDLFRIDPATSLLNGGRAAGLWRRRERR